MKAPLLRSLGVLFLGTSLCSGQVALATDVPKVIPADTVAITPVAQLPSAGAKSVTPDIPKGKIADSAPVVPDASKGTPITPAPAISAPVFVQDGNQTLVNGMEVVPCKQSRIWASGDFLLWWTKNGPVPLPLVTTSTNPADQGILGRPTTQVLFGNQDINFGERTGYRLTVGGWLDENATIGVEGTGFLFDQSSKTNFSLRSDSAGSPLLALPFFDINPAVNAPSSIVVSTPDQLFPRTGGINIRSTSQMWGAEFNALAKFSGNDKYKLYALAGFRYFDLLENLDVDGAIDRLLVTPDHFGARNQFFAGQIGLRGELTKGILFASLTGKVAIGSVYQTVDIQGSTTGLFNPLLFSPNAGVYAQPTNIGRHNQCEFAFLPEVKLQVGANILRNLRAYVGYDFMYLSSVVRPGEQIDGVLNSSQFGIDFNTGQPRPLVGPARPTALMNTTDFWAQGIHFGLEFRY